MLFAAVLLIAQAAPLYAAAGEQREGKSLPPVGAAEARYRKELEALRRVEEKLLSPPRPELAPKPQPERQPEPQEEPEIEPGEPGHELEPGDAPIGVAGDGPDHDIDRPHVRGRLSSREEGQAPAHTTGDGGATKLIRQRNILVDEVLRLRALIEEKREEQEYSAKRLHSLREELDGLREALERCSENDAGDSAVSSSPPATDPGAESRTVDALTKRWLERKRRTKQLRAHDERPAAPEDSQVTYVRRQNGDEKARWEKRTRRKILKLMAKDLDHSL